MGEAADDKAMESWARPCLTGKGWLRIQTETSSCADNVNFHIKEQQGKRRRRFVRGVARDTAGGRG